MAILVNQDTKLCTSGITGREGTFHTLNNRKYGTNDKEGRQLLADAQLPNVHVESTMLGAAERVVELAKGA